MGDGGRGPVEFARETAAVASLMLREHGRSKQHWLALLVLILVVSPLWAGYMQGDEAARIEGLLKTTQVWSFLLALYVVGDAVSREVRSRRLSLLRVAGVRTSALFFGVAGFWLASYLVLSGCAAGALYLTLSGPVLPSAAIVAALAGISLGFLPLVALGLGLAPVLRGWANVAALLGMMLALLVANFLSETAPWAEVPFRAGARLLFAPPLTSPAGGGPPVLYTDWPFRLLHAVVPSVLYLLLGALAMHVRLHGIGNRKPEGAPHGEVAG